MQLIHVVGPPAAGKSTLCDKLHSEYSGFAYLAIDEYRKLWKEEDLAWGHLELDMNLLVKVILETSGLSWRIAPLLKRFTNLRMYTLGLTGSPKILKDRLKKRQKAADVPFPYSWDEEQTIDYVVENLDMYPFQIDLLLDVTNRTSEEVYRIFKKEIKKWGIS